jgi:hypothetical protein
MVITAGTIRPVEFEAVIVKSHLGEVALRKSMSEIESVLTGAATADTWTLPWLRAGVDANPRMVHSMSAAETEMRGAEHLVMESPLIDGWSRTSGMFPPLASIAKGRVLCKPLDVASTGGMQRIRSE